MSASTPTPAMGTPAVGGPGAGAGLLGGRGTRRRLTATVAIAVVIALVLSLIGWGIDAAVSGPGTYRIKAVFSAAPGIYSGNSVTVLGVRVGSVDSVTPGPNGVTVSMSIDDGTKIPAKANVYLMAPNVVNNRFLEIDPGYTGGRSLAPGSVVPLSRTVIPQSVDQILASVNQLSKELGPKGANANGALSRLLHAVATRFGGTGGSINASIKNVGDAFAAVSAHAGDLTSLLNNLGGLTHTAAGISSLYERFADDLAQVSSTFADDHAAIGSALRNLGDVLSQLNTFVRNNRTQLAGTLNSLSKVAATLGEKQQALAKTLGVLPLAVQNVGKTLDGSSVSTRLDVPKNLKLPAQVCGNAVLRLLLISLDPQEDKIPTMDLACGANSLLNDLAPSPGAPDAKNFTLQGLLTKLGAS